MHTHNFRAWYSCTASQTPQVVVITDEEGRNNKGGIYRWEIEESHLFAPNTKCIYEGSLVDGKPHGYGTWVDTSYQGDLLRGYWAGGYPIGPFESMEKDTRNILANLRIVYGTDSGGSSFLQRFLSRITIPYISRTPLAVGVASIETCISGNFFKGYPMVNFLTGPVECKKGDKYIKELLDGQHYIHIDDEKRMVCGVCLVILIPLRRLSLSM